MTRQPPPLAVDPEEEKPKGSATSRRVRRDDPAPPTQRAGASSSETELEGAPSTPHDDVIAIETGEVEITLPPEVATGPPEVATGPPEVATGPPEFELPGSLEVATGPPEVELLASLDEGDATTTISDAGSRATMPDAGLELTPPAFRTTIEAASELADLHIVHSVRAHERLTAEHPGRYRFERALGEGGIGRVYAAHDNHLGRQVAVKELLDTVRASMRSDASGQAPIELRFVNEARITGQLEHPGIVPVYELGRREDGTVYYTMRQVRGRTLEKALVSSDLAGRLELLPHFVDLCNTMAYAHSRGVVHRDLKPENVMLGDFGETVVLDWGLAKVRGETDIQSDALEDELRRLAEQSAIKTVAGVPIGTPAYMSPEQARGHAEDIDERSDVYSLGVILYQLLTGTIPFDGNSARAVIKQVLEADPVPAEQLAPGCPPELAAIAARAMKKDPADRYPDAQALAADVRAFMSGGLVGAHSYTIGDNLLRFWRRRKRMVLAVVATIVVALTAWWYRGVDDARREALESAAHRARAVAEVEQIFTDVAEGNLQERWLDVLTFKVLSLRDPISAEAVEDELIEGLQHPSSDVRRLSARTLAAVKSTRAVDALVARTMPEVEPSQEVLIETINALGVIGDPRAEEPVREARIREGQSGYVWTQTELAYRMIPLPAVDSDVALSSADWNMRGTAFLWKGQYEGALRALDRAVEADPDNISAYISRAVVRRRFGDLDGALADYDRVLALDPGEVRALNNRAILKRSMEDYEGALRDIDRVVAEGSLGVQALRTRALIYRFMGNYSAAHADLQLALDLDPSDARTYANVAGVWLWAGELEPALAALDQAVRLNPSYHYAQLLRAQIHWTLGRREQARADIDRVLAFDPADNLARRMRAILSLELGDPAAARRDLDYCLENQCINEQARRALRHAQRGVAYYAALGDHSRALDDLDKALTAEPRGVDAFGYRLAAAVVSQRAGDEAAVLRWLDEIARHTEGGTLWYHRVAAMLRGEERFEELEAAFHQPLQKCTLYLAAGLMAERSGDPQSARLVYARAASLPAPQELSCLLATQAERALAR